MAASDPVGGQKFWFNGVPYPGVSNPAVSPNGLKYWFNGVPVDTLIPASSGAPTPSGTVLYDLINVG